MLVDSWCRQQVHGAWDGGHYIDGETDLPGADPTWPVRTTLLEGCPTVFGALKDAGTTNVPGPPTQHSDRS